MINHQMEIMEIFLTLTSKDKFRNEINAKSLEIFHSSQGQNVARRLAKFGDLFYPQI